MKTTVSSDRTRANAGPASAGTGEMVRYRMQQKVNDSPRQLAQHDCLAGPRMAIQRRLTDTDMVHDWPCQVAQRKATERIRNSPYLSMQRRTQEGDIADKGPKEGAGESLQSQVGQREEAHARPNKTGIPDNLKSGIESLSGMSMDNVRVHFNSPKPAQLNAHAFAQGVDIHVAPGQEQHLPHETWHVVQQAQGRVRPTRQMMGDVPVNDDKSLEHEADVMGGTALRIAQRQKARSGPIARQLAQRQKLHSLTGTLSGHPHIAQRHHRYAKQGYDYTSGDQDMTEIYAIVEKSSGDVVYVGQTCSGVGHVSRFENGHLTSGYHSNWSKSTHKSKLLEQGNWTLLEAACAEQWWIDHWGGVDNLENGIRALTLSTFNSYRDDLVTTPTLKGNWKPRS